MSGPAFTVVPSGGIAVTQVASGAPALKMVASGGIAVTVVASGGIPFVLEGYSVGTISNLTATAESSFSVLLAFTPAANATFHQYRINGGSPVTCDDNTGSQLVSGLSASTAYNFEVRGVNATGSGNWSNVASATTNAAGDVTAPTLSLPTGVQTGPTTATVGATTNEGEGLLYWVVTTSSTTPTTTQIKAGQNNSGTVAVASGSVAVGSTGAKTASVTGLTASTAYYAHLAQTDLALNTSNAVSSAQFTTAVAPDVTAPTLSSPTDAANGAAGGTLSVSTNEANGTLYWFISTSATPPSAANLKAGTGATSFGSQAVTATGVQNVTATGLAASTAYYSYFLHRDSTGNDSTISAADGFTTSTVTAPVLTRTSTAGDNPMTWSGSYTDMIVGTDYITMRHRVNGGSWVNSTNHLFTSDDYLDSIDGTAVFAWDAYEAAVPFTAGVLVEVEEGVLRDGVTTWSSILSDTMAAPAFTPNALWLASEVGDWWDVNDRSTMFQDTAGATPVTAVGQTIKRWVGKRGVFTLTDTTGLQLLNDGTSDYVYGAGTGKLVSTAAASVTDGSGQMTVFGSFKVSSATVARQLFNVDDGGVSRIGNCAVTNTSGQVSTSHYNTLSALQSDVGASITANTRFTTRGRHSTSAIESFVNGSSSGSTAVTGTLRSGTSIVQLFYRSGAANEGKVYKGFGLIGRLLTGTEPADLDTWTAS